MNTQFIQLYIDPGTGAMLFSVLIGVVTALFYFLQKMFMKLRFVVSGGKVKDISGECLEYVIFSDSKRYWNVFKPICDEFEKRKIKCEYWTASPDDPALSNEYEYVNTAFIGEGNKAFARLNMMKADICLATTPGLDVYQWKRSKNVKYYVHTLHEVGGVTEYRMFGLDYYDAVLLSGEFQEKYLRIIEGLRNLPEKETFVVGSTYMDSMKEKLDGIEAPEKNDDITVLVAPSWGESSILSRYGKTFIKALIETGYNIIIRPHPQTAISEAEMLDNLKREFPENNRFSWNFDNDNFSVLNRADILISDFSGVIFDFTLLFDKPMIYADTNLDLSPYDAAWIDEPVWRQQVLPQLGRKLEEKEFENLKQIIYDMIHEEYYHEKREEIKKIAWQHEGQAAVRTVDYLVKKHESLVKKEEV